MYIFGQETYEAHPVLFQNDWKYCNLSEAVKSFFLSLFILDENSIKTLVTDFDLYLKNRNYFCMSPGYEADEKKIYQIDLTMNKTRLYTLVWYQIDM